MPHWPGHYGTVQLCQGRHCQLSCCVVHVGMHRCSGEVHRGQVREGLASQLHWPPLRQDWPLNCSRALLAAQVQGQKAALLKVSSNLAEQGYPAGPPQLVCALPCSSLRTSESAPTAPGATWGSVVLMRHAEHAAPICPVSRTAA